MDELNQLDLIEIFNIIDTSWNHTISTTDPEYINIMSSAILAAAQEQGVSETTVHNLLDTNKEDVPAPIFENFKDLYQLCKCSYEVNKFFEEYKKSDPANDKSIKEKLISTITTELKNDQLPLIQKMKENINEQILAATTPAKKPGM